MSTDHVTQDVVRVGQELVVKTVSKMYIAEHLNQIKFRRFKHKYKLSASLFFLACVSGNFGEDCKSICGKCLIKDDCYHTNGTCLNGCGRGYQGPLCKTRKYINMKKDFFYLIKTLYQKTLQNTNQSIPLGWVVTRSYLPLISVNTQNNACIFVV